MSDFTIFVVDDDPAMRDSLDEFLTSAGLRVELYASAEQFLEEYDRERPGCLILDLRMGGMTGLELQQHLVEAGTDLPVIVITGHGDVSVASRSFRMGAVDVMAKPYDGRELLERLRSAREQNTLSRQERARLADISGRLASLSEAERKVLDLVIDGHPNKLVAMRLGIAERTVEDRRARLMTKMQVQSLPELARLFEWWRTRQSVR
jgi:FixJ family two-component response regulator